MYAMTQKTLGLHARGRSSSPFHLPAINNKEEISMSRLNALVLRRTDDNSKDVLFVCAALFIALVGVLALF